MDLQVGADVGTARNLAVQLANDTLWAFLDNPAQSTHSTLGIHFSMPLFQNQNNQSLLAGQSLSCDPTFRGEIRLPSATDSGLSSYLLIFADAILTNDSGLDIISFRMWLEPNGAAVAKTGECVPGFLPLKEESPDALDVRFHGGAIPGDGSTVLLYGSDTTAPVVTVQLGDDETVLTLFACAEFVPEPATVGLLSVGVFGLMLRRKRR